MGSSFNILILTMWLRHTRFLFSTSNISEKIDDKVPKYTSITEVVEQNDLVQIFRRRSVHDTVHCSQQRRPRFIVKDDDDAGRGQMFGVAEWFTSGKSKEKNLQNAITKAREEQTAKEAGKNDKKKKMLLFSLTVDHGRLWGFCPERSCHLQWCWTLPCRTARPLSAARLWTEWQQFHLLPADWAFLSFGISRTVTCGVMKKLKKIAGQTSVSSQNLWKNMLWSHWRQTKSPLENVKNCSCAKWKFPGFLWEMAEKRANRFILLGIIRDIDDQGNTIVEKNDEYRDGNNKNCYWCSQSVGPWNLTALNCLK